jgi:hypothetical protein
MNAPDISHALAPDLALIAPPTFAIRSAAQGLSAIEAATGVVLTALLKPSANGTPDDQRLLESAVALVQKKHAGAERLGAPEPITIGGHRGRCALLRATTPANASIDIAVTVLIVPDVADAAQQRNLIVVLEVPTPVFAQRPTFYRQFVQDRLRIGAATTVPAAPLVLELAPLEEPAKPESPAAPTEPPPAPVPAATPRPAQTAAAPRRAGPRIEPAEPDEDALLASAARGQRTLAISIALTFVARAIGNVPDVPVLMAYFISAAVLFYAVSGLLQICSGFRYSQNQKLVLMFCSSIPLIGIVCWVWLSVRTTRRLRAAGFQVGLFGVRS